MRQAPAWDRFGHWPPLPARILLAAIAALLVLAALPYVGTPGGEASGSASAGTVPPAPAAGPGRDQDLELYRRIVARIATGDSYYRAAIEEQRARGFPVRPGLAVRLPMLAVASAWLGPWGLDAAAVLLGLTGLQLNVVVRVLLTTLVATPIMTYGLLPWMTKRFEWWLKPHG